MKQINLNKLLISIVVLLLFGLSTAIKPVFSEPPANQDPVCSGGTNLKWQSNITASDGGLGCCAELTSGGWTCNPGSQPTCDTNFGFYRSLGKCIYSPNSSPAPACDLTKVNIMDSVPASDRGCDSSQSSCATCKSNETYCRYNNVNACFKSGSTFTISPTECPEKQVSGLRILNCCVGGKYIPEAGTCKGGVFVPIIKDKNDKLVYCYKPGYTFGFDAASNSCVATNKSSVFLCFQDTCETALGIIPTDPGGFIQTFLKYALMFAGLALIVTLISVGYKVLTSAGNPEKIQAAKEMATSLFAGIILIVFSMVLLQAIGVDILNLPGLK